MHNLAAIGFEIGSLAEFKNLADDAFRKGTHFRAGRNEYVRFRDVSGAELWVQQDEELEITGMQAFFDAQHWIEAELVEALAHEDRPLDGTFEALAIFDNAEAPKLSFYFDLPDAHLVPKVSLPAKAKIQLVAFADALTVFPSETAFKAFKPHAPTQSLQSKPVTEDAELSSLVHLTAQVREAKTLHNAHSGNDFHWLLVDTILGKIELMASTTNLKALPQHGHILDGTVYLSGRVSLAENEPLKPGIFERLFWGAATNTRR